MTAEVRIGTSGWSYPDWEGVVYPGGGAGFRQLRYLAEFLDAVEVNTTFYRPPAPRLCAAWLRDTAAQQGFRFAVKLWQRFTHAAEPWGEAEVRQFREAIRPLTESGRLGAVLAQYPWSFTHTRENAFAVKHLADAFADLPLVIEVRHASWQVPEYLTWLQRRGIGFCNIDQPPARNAIGETNYVTGPVAYYRLHGRNREAWFDRAAGRDQRYNYLYSPKELAPWIRRIQEARQLAAVAFVMANNHFRGQALVNALQLRAALAGGRVRVPPALMEHYPILREIAVEP